MERLTIDELIAHCNRQLDRLPSGNKTYQEHESVRGYLQILRHYMNTGLGPEEIEKLCEMGKRAEMANLLRLEEYQALGSLDHLRELVEAEKAGRLVALPCKVGDTVYFIEKRTNGKHLVRKGFAYAVEYCVCRKPLVTIRYDDKTLAYTKHYLGHKAFLTREKAEATLEREKGGGEG